MRPLFDLIKNHLVNHFGYKIVAVFLAVLTWYMVQGEEILEQNHTLLVTIKTPKGLKVDKGETILKDVTLKGTRALLAGINSKRPLQTEIIVPEGRTGRMNFRLDKDAIKGLDRHIDLQIHDPYVVIYVDFEMTRKLMVKEFLIGTPADGYRILNASIEPKYIKVSGLRSLVSLIKKIQTEPIDISGIKEKTTYNVNIESEILEKHQVNVSEVKVTLEVGEDIINKTYDEIPIDVDGDGAKLLDKIHSATITIQGTGSDLNFVEKSELRAFVDVRENKPGTYEKEVQVKIPGQTALIEVKPKTIKVEVKNVKKKDKAQKKIND